MNLWQLSFFLIKVGARLHHDLISTIKTDANNYSSETMQMLFKGFPEECDALKSLKEGAMDTASTSKWSTEWETNALPLVNQASAQTLVTRIVINTHMLRSLIYFLIQNCRSVDKMCANIYSIRRTVIYFRESEIGVLDYWSEQMCIKTQRFSLLSPAAARISCYDVRPFSKSNSVILVIQYKALSFQDRKMYSLLSTCLNCFRMYSCIQQ